MLAQIDSWVLSLSWQISCSDNSIRTDFRKGQEKITQTSRTKTWKGDNVVNIFVKSDGHECGTYKKRQWTNQEEETRNS